MKDLFKMLQHGAEMLADGYSFSVNLGGRTVAMHFVSKEQAADAEMCLAGNKTTDTNAVDAHFWFWNGDCSPYMSLTHSGLERYQDENGLAILMPPCRIIGADVSGHDFYCCIHEPDKNALIPFWVVNFLVSQWGVSRGLLSVHGGVVGINGKGVLLSANGGGGKSTLVATCMQQGMEYVADDYILISTEGMLTASPVFSTLNMNMDMKTRLGLDFPVVWENPSKNGKQLLDVSSLAIRRNMPIKAVVFLNRTGKEGVETIKASNPAVRLVQSAFRAERIYDAQTIKATIKRLSQVPAYEMRLGTDLGRNADELRLLIERME